MTNFEIACKLILNLESLGLLDKESMDIIVIATSIGGAGSLPNNREGAALLVRKYAYPDSDKSLDYDLERYFVSHWFNRRTLHAYK